jgi:hypothetical protein
MPEIAFPHILPSALGILALLVATAGAQPVTASETPAHYDVEVIVFQNLSGHSDAEHWPLADEDSYTMPGQRPLGGILSELPVSAHRMQRIADSLNRSGAYRVITHRAWRQSARGRAGAVPFPVSDTADNLDGTITLVRERFLHLDVDLMLQSTYSLQEKRRMRSGELHYFDHPLFGVIAEVNPYSAPAPVVPAEPAAPDAGEPEGRPSTPEIESPVPLPGHRVRQAPY